LSRINGHRAFCFYKTRTALWSAGFGGTGVQEGVRASNWRIDARTSTEKDMYKREPARAGPERDVSRMSTMQS